MPAHKDPNSIKRRIIAMKQANPKMPPREIAKALGCSRKYACDVLSTELLAGEHMALPQKPRGGSSGSGRRRATGYLRLI